MSKKKNKPSNNTQKENSAESKPQLEGLVVSVLGKGYFVLVNDEEWLCRVRGRFFLENDRAHPVVGDRVVVEPMEDEKTGIITVIYPRSSSLSRKLPDKNVAQVMASNIDQVLIFSAIIEPDFVPNLVDRYLLTCEANHLTPIVILNKCDLVAEDEVQYDVDEFGLLGYKSIAISAKTGQGLEELKELLVGKKTIITGPSGSGKSTTINAIFPNADMKTKEVNLSTGKGRHTTTVTRLFLVEDGYVMDSPGIREFGLWDIHSEKLSELFREFIPFAKDCYFRDCKHINEPKCAVKEAVEREDIFDRRYEHYVFLREELEAKEKEYK